MNTVIAYGGLLAALMVGVVLGATLTRKSSRKAKTKVSNMVLLALGIFLLAFIVTMIVVFCVKGSVPDTLIQYTLGAGGVEAVVLAGIKISKVIAGQESGGSEET